VLRIVPLTLRPRAPPLRAKSTTPRAIAAQHARGRFCVHAARLHLGCREVSGASVSIMRREAGLEAPLFPRRQKTTCHFGAPRPGGLGPPVCDPLPLPWGGPVLVMAPTPVCPPAPARPDPSSPTRSARKIAVEEVRRPSRRQGRRGACSVPERPSRPSFPGADPRSGSSGRPTGVGHAPFELFCKAGGGPACPRPPLGICPVGAPPLVRCPEKKALRFSIIQQPAEFGPRALSRKKIKDQLHVRITILTPGKKSPRHGFGDSDRMLLTKGVANKLEKECL